MRRLAVLAFTCRVSEKVILKWQAESGLSFNDFWALANVIGWRNEQDLKNSEKTPPDVNPHKKPAHRLKKLPRK